MSNKALMIDELQSMFDELAVLPYLSTVEVQQTVDLLIVDLSKLLDCELITGMSQYVYLQKALSVLQECSRLKSIGDDAFNYIVLSVESVYTQLIG